MIILFLKIRCFFIHIGIAIGIHPFALQSYFRHTSTNRLSCLSDSGTLESEILQSCLQYAGFVDANCLNFIWPQEFHRYQILLISGTNSPIFTLFYLPNVSNLFYHIINLFN